MTIFWGSWRYFGIPDSIIDKKRFKSLSLDVDMMMMIYDDDVDIDGHIVENGHIVTLTINKKPESDYEYD